MKAKLTDGELLIARGLNILIRMSAGPVDPAASLKHFTALKADIGPWLTDYSESVEFTLTADASDSAV